MFKQENAEIFVPDSLPAQVALERTTHLAVAAHQDDIEIMAAAPILECFQKSSKWFTGVVVTDGRGSPRDGIYKDFSDEEMRQVRIKEQKKAAIVGEYSAQVFLDYPSRKVKDGYFPYTAADISELLEIAKPKYVYTHNLADKHETHVAVALRVIQAIRKLPAEARPDGLYGCEVWRDLDWMLDDEKVAFDLSVHENLQSALVGVYDSQIAGGKRYDLATKGRRRAHATYFQSHGVDQSNALTYGMNLTPLITHPELDIEVFVNATIQRFAKDVVGKITRFQ